MDLKQHWEAVYGDPTKVKHTWTQSIPDRTLNLIERAYLKKDDAIIDVGGGDSTLVDHLLSLGYTNITVLDISEKAIERSKKRLGDKAELVNWVVSNILEYVPNRTFQCWVDRATFHFLRSDHEIKKYYSVLDTATKEGSNLIVATFSEIGPAQCSGLPVMRYDKFKLTQVFAKRFDRHTVVKEDHITPSNTLQQFIYLSMRKRKKGSETAHLNNCDELYLSDLTPINDEFPSCGIAHNKNCC